MTGRYGIDQLNRFLLSFSCVLLILAVFVRGANIYGGIFVRSSALFALLIFYYRMFSRNFSKRQQENNLYLKYKDKLLYGFKKIKYKLEQKKTHHIYSCPECKQRIRIPRGKGRIQITCPRCRHQFIKKS
ncbi:MAG: hypothetical protein GX288_05915 [Clostridiales bacterium]|nr:hypothetical protein [Clostridiales bacterium]